jgi:hypothetical protein
VGFWGLEVESAFGVGLGLGSEVGVEHFLGGLAQVLDGLVDFVAFVVEGEGEFDFVLAG